MAGNSQQETTRLRMSKMSLPFAFLLTSTSQWQQKPTLQGVSQLPLKDVCSDVDIY